MADKIKSKDCEYCNAILNELKKEYQLEDDISQKIQSICPYCGKIKDPKKTLKVQLELKAYFDKIEKPSNKKCAVCGKTGRRMALSDCCNLPMCTEAPKRSKRYRNKSCWEGHARYTLCGAHHLEGHKGDWKDCEDCKGYETEMYVWYGTNEYNVEKLPDPPEYEPTKCARCNKTISLVKDGYGEEEDGYVCWDCLTWCPILVLSMST